MLDRNRDTDIENRPTDKGRGDEGESKMNGKRNCGTYIQWNTAQP